jgi:hypothetical protein
VLFFGTHDELGSELLDKPSLPLEFPMHIRMILFSTLMLFCAGSTMAQRAGPEFWRRVSCEPVEPRTKLERIDDRNSTVIIKGFTRITTVEVSGVRIDAVDMRELGNVSRAKGIVVVLTAPVEGNNRPRNQRAFVDYEEIDPLLNAIDAASRVDETITKFPGFEAKYRTLGDLEITVFRQTRSGNAALLTTGVCEQGRTALTLDELAKVRAMIQEAKARLDEIR